MYVLYYLLYSQLFQDFYKTNSKELDHEFRDLCYMGGCNRYNFFLIINNELSHEDDVIMTQ